MSLIIGVPKEVVTGEKRVALDPSTVEKLDAAGIKVIIEKNAGIAANFSDADYRAQVVANAKQVYQQADVIAKVQPPTLDEIKLMRKAQLYIGFIDPYRNKEVVHALAKAEVTSLAMELIPRISRAQAMDALSSQAGIVGYKCVILAASLCPGYFPMLTTAAGTIKPANVLIIGAGVAGLQAIATAKRLGAIVEAYDIRPDAKEQVESLGAKLIDTGVNAIGEGGYARPLTKEEQQQQADVLAKHIKNADAVVTTAALPGRDAPKIISAEMVHNMHRGAVIVDMAAETGGNCELTVKGETIVTKNGVTVAGPCNVASTAQVHASQMYAKNIYNLLDLMLDEGKLEPNWEDEVLKGACLTKDGALQHEHVKSIIGE